MKCQKCQSNNPEDSNFCLECGTKMEQVCSHCGKSVPLRAKFCNACGHRFGQPAQSSLKEPSLQEKLEKVQRYLPKGLLKKILSQRDSIEGERRQVTIMFCDVKGFTGMAEKLGPDETFSLMNQVFEIFLQKVNEYQGTVNEFRGDGILAFFGAPIALEDAPQRAIRSALTIHKEIQKFNEKISGRWEIAPIQLRIGLNTGQVVVGTVGNDLRVQYTAQGDTINMAARMESIAEPGTIYVTKETFEQTEGYFRFEALGAQYIKGKAEPLEVYKVIAPSSRRTRFDISAERGLTPFVGRQRELELLIDGYRRSRAGRGQSFSIVSEAGLGKSRLLYEFRKKIVHDNVTFLEGRCLSYSRWIAYHPIIDVLKSNFNLAEADKDKTIAAKVKKGLKAIAANDPDTRAHILELFSIKDAQTQDVFINQEEKRYRLVEALKRVVIKGSEIRPLVLAVEDLHWIDQSSEDAFKSLLRSISGSSVFLIFTYRPEYVHTWGTRTYHSQLNLNRFSNRESLLMVHHLLGTTAVEELLEELILEKAEGVPFFIEELIRSLEDLSIIERKNKRCRLVKTVQEVTIPNTIQDVIMTRVDSLPETARSVLVAASAIEREFSHELLKKVIGISEQELLACLSVLKDSELIYERGLYPHSAYIFKHAVTHEVVYDSIINSKRKQLHNKIGRAIETLFQENLQDYYGVLAEHYIRSGNYEKGAEFCKYASKQAFGSASFGEAIGHVRNLIFCLERLQQNESNQERIIKARTALAMYLINVSQNEGLLDAVAPVEKLASMLNDKKMLARIYIALGIYHYSIEEDFQKGLRYLKDTSNMAALSNDFLSAYYAFFYLGCHYTWSCEFSKAQLHFNKCVELSTAANNPIGASNPRALAAYAHCYSGEIEKTHTLVKEGIKFAEQSGFIFCKTPAYTAYGICCYYHGTFDEAEKYLLMGVDFSKKASQIGWEHWGCFNLGNMYLDTGNLVQAREYLNRSISIIQQYKLLPLWILNCRVALGKVMVLSSDMNVNLHEMIGLFDNNKFIVNRGYIARNIAEILLSLGDNMSTDAELWVVKAIENDQRNNVMWSLARDYAVYADCLQRQNEQKKADEYFRKAVNTFKWCGAESWIAKIEADYKKPIVVQ